MKSNDFLSEGINHPALQGWDQMNAFQKGKALWKAGLIGADFAKYDSEELDNILHKAKLNAQDREHELTLSTEQRVELKRKADELKEIKRQLLRKERLEDEKLAYARAKDKAEREAEMEKIKRKYEHELNVIDREHRNNMEAIRTGNSHEIEKMDKEHRHEKEMFDKEAREKDKDRIKPEPTIIQPSKSERNSEPNVEPNMTKPNKPQRPTPWHTSQQVGYTPSKREKPKDDDIIDVDAREIKPNKPLALPGIKEVSSAKPWSARDIESGRGNHLTPNNISSAKNEQGLTQQEWLKKVKLNYSTDEIVTIKRAKMIDGPILVVLKNGKKLLWKKAENDQPSNITNEGLRDPKDNPCWKGYKPVGTKKKNGKTVPNCVPKESVEEGSDKLQGTPVVSLSDFDDKDTKKDKYGRTVPKKLKKDDPRVKFHKDQKQGVAEGDFDKWGGEIKTPPADWKKKLKQPTHPAKLARQQAANHQRKQQQKQQGVAEGGFFDPDQPNPGDLVRHKYNKAVGKVKSIATQGNETWVYFKDNTTGEMNYGQWKKHVFPVKTKGVAEGAEFGSNYAEQLAQKVFDKNSNLDTSGRASELLNAGYAIAKAELGKIANGIFRNEDFPSDFVSSYNWLQRNKQNIEEEQLDELSLETLASYKKKAGQQARELDKAAFGGDKDAKAKIAKANKRFSGIMKATKKEFDQPKAKVDEFVQGYNMNQAGVRKYKPKHVPNQDEIQKMSGIMEGIIIKKTK